MASYIIRRLLLVIPTLIGMTLVIFLVMAMSPGGISAALISREGNMKPQERRAMEKYLNDRYGLDKPMYVQYLKWMNKVSPIGLKPQGTGFPASLGFGFKAPDLGESFVRRRPVADLITEALPITFLLNLVSFPIIYATAIIAGIRAASRRGQAFDVASGTIFLALWSVPVTLAAVLGIGFLTSQQYPHLKWFPTNGLHDLLSADMHFLPSHSAAGFERGYLLDTAWHLILPVICMCYADFAFLSKLTRGAVLENVVADYARTARAKGVSQRNVLYRHVFHNSLLPLITVGAHIIPGMLSGAVIVETIFGLNGMGRLVVQAVFQKDIELVLSEALIAGLLGLGSYLLSDILYAVADPRVKFE
ncbi:ABC transporter permease [soil metagenome]